MLHLWVFLSLLCQILDFLRFIIFLLSFNNLLSHLCHIYVNFCHIYVTFLKSRDLHCDRVPSFLQRMWRPWNIDRRHFFARNREEQGLIRENVRAGRVRRDRGCVISQGKFMKGRGVALQQEERDTRWIRRVIGSWGRISECASAINCIFEGERGNEPTAAAARSF